MIFRKVYIPGDTVPVDEVFWVHHYQHRLPHLCQTILKNFPACATCGEKVRYEAAVVRSVEKAVFLRFDSDFKAAWDLSAKGRRSKRTSN